MADREDSTARPPEDEGRSARSTATLFVSVLVIGLVVILGAFLTYQFSKGDSTPGAAGPVTAPASTTAAATGTAPPAQGGYNSLTAAPAGTRWELYQGVALPYSATAGPSRVEGLGVASGYSHDAEGALFAAAQIDTRRFLAPDASWRSVVDTQVAPGQGRDTWIASRSSISIAPNSVPSARLLQVAGFKVSNYTDTVATISIARKTSTGGFQVGDLTLTWLDGDWKLVLLSNGSSATTYPVTDLSVNGFVAWAGV